MEYIAIAVLDNEFEADLLAAALLERAIPHRLRSYRDIAYDGLFQANWGWGSVYASAADREEILAVLADIRKSRDE